MSKSPKEKLSDLLIGEAVMNLLEADEEVTFTALLKALTEARDRPENEARRAAYNMAIDDVKSYVALYHQGAGTTHFAATEMSGKWLMDGLSSCVNDRKH
ncbi:hypothetical protein CHU32_06530 [Superficieibacter electus]|uniref:Uncharacterized protein n=1 Tax=Superficieibacter electus TaxID=2022662 RepID=A0A2P5GTK6_9ENTR|nr:hypothetical protein [Superficieibacter electus]POP46402.1 hypothetical protein CHU33_06515 [Superficieibacter electus]POP49873.1 hypothetical protein CHU32_06530 [Superficieibacter electus]